MVQISINYAATTIGFVIKTIFPYKVEFVYHALTNYPTIDIFIFFYFMHMVHPCSSLIPNT
jgi:hypothetical protein